MALYAFEVKVSLYLVGNETWGGLTCLQVISYVLVIMSETEATTCNEVYSVVVVFILLDDLSCYEMKNATKCTLCCSGL